MRVARLYGARDLRLPDEPPPAVPAGHSLVRVTAVGLCGSDLHWYGEGGIGDARVERPLVVGHEFAGVVEGGPRRGQRVAVDPAMPCERCASCRAGHHNLCPHVRFAGSGEQDGALSEFVAWPSALLHPLPDELSDADGAMLEPLGVAIHAVELEGSAGVGVLAVDHDQRGRAECGRVCGQPARRRVIGSATVVSSRRRAGLPGP